jgi:uncharacterized protein YciU (UPF0263 family)
MSLTEQDTQNIKDALDAIVQIVVRDPKTDLNPARIFEITDQLTDEGRAQLTTELLAIHMSLGVAFQRATYAEVPNPLNMSAAGLAASCLGEAIAFLATQNPSLFDSPAAGRRASYMVGEARRICLTQTAGRLILPGE